MPLQEIANAARKEGRTLLTEVEAKQVLKEAGVDVVDTRLARTKDEALKLAAQFGFPVAAKIISPEIVHKSDIGGVKLGLQTAVDVGSAFDDIMAAAKKAHPRANIHGVSIQPMAKPGIEVILGMTKDAQFGPVLMFGLGGVLVEILKDVSFRIVPLEPKDATAMIKEIKGYPLLAGYRGQEPANIPLLEQAILKLSAFVDKHPEIKELDLNPIFAYKDGLAAADARIVLEA